MIIFAVQKEIIKNITMSKKQSETPILADEVLGKSEAFVIKYKKPIVSVVVAIIVCVVAYLAYSTYVAAPREVAADKAIFKAEQYFANGDFESALNGDGINAGFMEIIENHSGTNAANIAYAYAGICKAQQENYDEAIALLKKFDGNDRVIAPMVKYTLGNCYAYKEDYSKAISTLLDAADDAENLAVTPKCWMDAAAMYEKTGKSDKALELYKRIKKEYPQAPEAMNIDKLINSAK